MVTTETSAPRRIRHPRTIISSVLALYAFCVPYETAFDVLTGRRTVFKPYRLVGLALIFVCMVGRSFRHGGIRLDLFDRLFLALFALGIVLGLSFYVVFDKGNMSYLANDFTLIFFGFLTYVVIKGQATVRDLSAMMTGLVLGTVSSILLFTLFFRGGDTLRVSGFMENPNSLGFCIGVSVLILATRLLFDSQRRGLTYGLAIVFLLTTLLFTGSRGAMIGTVVGAVSIAITLRWVPFTTRRRHVGFASIFAIITVLFISGVAVFNVYSRFQHESAGIARLNRTPTEAAGNRLDLLESAWHLSEHHYFVGVGLSQYRYYYSSSIAGIGELRAPSLAQARDLGTHNTYADILTGTGVLGLSLYLLILIQLFRSIRQTLRADSEGNSEIAASLPLFVFILIISFDNGLLINPSYWMVMAWVSLHALRSTPRTSAPQQLVTVGKE